MAEKPGIFNRILAPYCLGILVSSQAEFAKLNLLLLLSIFTLIILLFIISYLYVSLKVYNYKQFLCSVIYVLLFLIGTYNFQQQNEQQKPNHFSKNNTNYISIIVADEPQQKGKTLRFKGKVTHSYLNGKRRPTTGTLLVTIFKTKLPITAITYGNSYLIPANYHAVPPAYNPGEFDISAWLSRQHIRQQIFLYPEEMILIGKAKASPLINYSLSLRRRGTTLFRRLIKDDEAYAVAATLILGYRADLGAETINSYARTGTIHALSVSGMHVGIIYLVLEFLLRWMNRNRLLKWVKIFLIIGLIWAYTLLSGYAPSILRSAIMLSLFILSKGLKKNADSFHILSFSAYCLLLFDPFLLGDIGFQLSYLAVLGLLYLQPKIEGLYTFQNRWVQQLWTGVCLSVSAQVFTFPLSIYLFHQFPLYFILGNLFITLPVALLMYLGIAILLFPLDWLAPIFERLILLMNYGLEMISHLPYAVINSIWISKTELALLCLWLYFLVKALTNNNKTELFLAMMALLSLQLMLVNDKIIALKQHKVVLFSLQKNYAVALVRAKKAVVITDLKPEDKTFQLHIQPALDQLKVQTINCLRWNQQLSKGGVTMKDHQLCFGKFRVLLMDSTFNAKRIIGHPSFDVVWLHGNPRVNIVQLRQEISFNKIWIDASNTSYSIHTYQQDTINFKGSTVVLKKIKAYLIDLK